MKNKILLIIGLGLLPYPALLAQSYCQNILKSATTSYQKGQLELAMRQLQDAETCDYKNELQKDRQTLQNKIFKAVNQAKRNAEKSAQLALAEQKKSERIARSNNNALKALRLDKTDPTLALRMAEANYLLYSESQSAVGIFQELLKNTDKAKAFKTIRKGHTLEVSAVAFSLDGQSILTGSRDKTAILWDLNGIELQKFQGHTSEVSAVAFSPDGQSILTGSADKTAILWDLNGTELQKFQGHTSEVSAVAFSPDGQSILTGSIDNTAILWDLKGTELQKFQGHTEYVFAVAFSPDGQFILTGSRDNTAILWDLHGTELQKFQGHTSVVFAVTFSPDGQSILTGSMDKTAILWIYTEPSCKNFKDILSMCLRWPFPLMGNPF